MSWITGPVPLAAIFSKVLMAALDVTVGVTLVTAVALAPCLLVALGARWMRDWRRARPWD